MTRRATSRLIVLLFCLFTAVAAAGAQPNTGAENPRPGTSMYDATQLVQKSTAVVHELLANPDTRETLKKAKGVFIVPEYQRAAFGVGGSGGDGILVANENGAWSDPAFYHLGGISLGMQAGVMSGAVAFFIMTDKAFHDFIGPSRFSLSADAGLHISNWNGRRQLPSADVIAWSDNNGLYGGLAITATNITVDTGANYIYYDATVSAEDIVGGKVRAPASAEGLKSEFAALESSSDGHAGNPGTESGGQE